MDTERERGAVEYFWPTDVVTALQLSKEDLGIVARGQVAGKTGSGADDVLPVLVGSVTAKPSRNYDLIIMAGSELTELYMSIAPAARRDLHGPRAESRRIEGYYPGNNPIHIDVPWPEASGLYVVRLGGLFRDGRSSTLTFNFFHSAQ